MPLCFRLILLLCTLSSCAPLANQDVHEQLQAFVATGDDLQPTRYAPVFIVENPDSDFNRIGTPSVQISPEGDEDIFIDNRAATLYIRKDMFTAKRVSYTNYIYRIHFEEVPHSFTPFHIGAGKNVGLLAIVTVDKSGNPILYTTVNTCGCYLAFVPTTYMPDDAFPPSWPAQRQTVYSENLPALLDIRSVASEQTRTMILLRDGTHRVKNIWIADPETVDGYTVKAKVHPVEILERIPLDDGTTTSFYQEKGSGRGYVKDSTKIWERLFMGWWAVDWKVGEDKKLGKDKNDPPVFYTSLKPWARDESDMRDFTSFLTYWGWNL